MRLGIWSEPGDLAADTVAALARRRGHEVTQVTPSRLGVDATDLSAWVLAGADLDPCAAHLVRALPSPLVTPEPGEGPADVARRSFVAQERLQLALAALAAAEARGARVLNPLASQPFESKPHQLACLAREGLPIPRTVATSLPLAAERFVEALAVEGGEAVVKPLLGGATARRVDAAARARLGTLGPGPVLLQERIVGEDVRVTVVAGDIVSAVVIASETLDYRDDPEYAAGRARYQTVELDDEGRSLALAAARACAHAVSGVDLKRTPTGRWVILEANSAPAWLDIEEKTGAAITAAVLDALAGR